MPTTPSSPSTEKTTDLAVTEDNKAIIVAEVLPRSSIDPSSSVLAEKTMNAIIEQPQLGRELTDAYRTIVSVQYPDILRAESERRTKVLGLQIGAGLTAVSLAGAIGIAVTAGPLVIAVGLLSVGAACAGATMVLASGGTTKPSDFNDMLSVFGKGGKKQEKAR
jgi:hypothetical protein